MADFTGTSGDDTLAGSSGADNLIGLAGNDRYIINDIGDVVVEAFSEGNDRVLASVSWGLQAGSHVETLSTIDNLATTAINLTGNELAQIIYGNAGANVLDGSGGGDRMYGLGGDDRYHVRSGADRVVEAAGEGSDRILAAVSFALEANSHVEILSTIDNLATTAINLTGNALFQQIFGNAGANQLDSGGGGDKLLGLGGDDRFVVRSAADRVVESAGEGNDRILAAVSFVLEAGSHVETLSMIDNLATTAINLTGNALFQIIFGNAGANQLDGAGGGDRMYGLGGDDRFFVRSGADRVVEASGEGNDRVFAATSFALEAGSHVEILSTIDNLATTAINLTGNALAQHVFGNAGANQLDGGGGGDTLLGLGGDDRYVVRSATDRVVESAGQGNDRILAAVSFVLEAGSHVEILSTIDNLATTAINLTGNELSQTLFGNAGANDLKGGGGGDTLRGLEGDDVLNGGAGADSLGGGAGADRIVFDTALGGGNIDTIVDFTLDVDGVILGGNSGEPFAAIASGTLSPYAFRVGTAATTAYQRILYDPTTGALLYDADGIGGVAPVQFATLAPSLAIEAGSFTVSGPTNQLPTVTSGTTASIAENSPVSTIVYQATAIDPDGDSIIYSLGGDDFAFFTIDSTGAVRFINSPDFEARSTYSINVFAHDTTADGGFRTVIVSVTNVLESGPTPIVQETSGTNDSTGSAQFIDRNLLAVSTNPNLPDPSLPSATIVGNLPDGTDRDFFSITLQAGEKLILDVDNSSGNLDAHVRVYNSSGVEIGDNDDPGTLDPGSDPHPTYGHNTDSFFSFRAPTAGTYYFSIESFQDAQNPTFGSYEINVSIGPVATPEQILEEDIQALIDSEGWPDPDPNTPGFNLTYAFPNEPNDYPPNTSEVNSNFEQFNPVQRAATAQMLQHMATFSNLVFTQLFDDQESAATLRYAMSDEAEVAYAYLPGGPLGGTAWFRNSPIDDNPTPSFDNPVPGSYSWMSILHETGHALGLKHGHEAPAVSFDRDSVEYTVMTYRSYPGQTIDGYSNETWGFPTTMMALDIAALQRLYGANFDFNAGNNVYSWSPSSGQMSVDGVGGLLPGGGNRVFMTVWDGGGNDTYDLSNYGNTVRIDLRPGEYSLTSQTQLANLGEGHFARGNVLNAFLFNGDTRSLIENAIAGSGNDTLIANQAANQLTGGNGSDTFRWHSATDAGLGGQADVVTDFVRGTDRLDLDPIDAIAGSPADDGFAFIGTNAFTNVAGQLRYQLESGGVRIQGDIDGNGVADLEIFVNNVTSLDGTDFFF